MFQLGLAASRFKSHPTLDEHRRLAEIAARIGLKVPDVGRAFDRLPSPEWFSGTDAETRENGYRIGVLAYALYLLRGGIHRPSVAELHSRFAQQALDTAVIDKYLAALAAGPVDDALESFASAVSEALARQEGATSSAMAEAAPTTSLPPAEGTEIGPQRPPFEAYKGQDPFLFASYAHANADLVYPELVRIRSLGLNIWYDEGIDPGNEWPDAIADAIARASCFVAFITPAAAASINCRNEINFALNRRKPFLAIHLVDTELPAGLQLRMGDIQAIMRHRMDDHGFARKLRMVFETLLPAGGGSRRS